MKKVFTILSVLFLSLAGVLAQQLPDPGFEDWSGATFDNVAQPKYWNFSNVEQMGVKKNFAHQATGRSGYCLEIKDQFVGFGTIGATSPGYVSLGQPWAYISSLTSINDATAGTYGGISWTHRPDSIVVWIKRTGANTSIENYNILYYAWSGTAQGGSYKAKNGSCTDISNSKPQYCVDEESDVRQALDGNECGTRVQANQIAEGWFYEKRSYDEWTELRVPIYYFNDEVPEKCNVILSAGNYPNFRANDGLYDGNTLFVDDISLVYSSKVQKLFVGGREWKGFDPNNTTTPQVYTLGQGATVIPEIKAVRGAGQLTNVHGNRSTFGGRTLGASECQITLGQVDGAVTEITVTAEDGSSTSTYYIQFVSEASNNARLGSIAIDGAALAEFNPYLTNYNVSLPYGTSSVPTVSATAQDGSATVVVTQAADLNGTATIQVTAGDGVTTQRYTIHFSVAQLSDATLQNILIDGLPLAGFVPTKSNYTVSLPLGTTEAPQVTPVSAYPDGAQTIVVLSNTLDGGCQIQVSAPAGATRTYKLTYKIEASSYAYLSGIALDGVAIDGFVPSTLSYDLLLPLGTSALPVISYTPGDAYQTVVVTTGGVEGVTRLVVTAAAGNTATYRLNFAVEKSDNNALMAIMLDGDTIADFAPEQTEYNITLPAGTKSVPTITYAMGDAYQSVRVVSTGLQNPVRLIVTAGDGSVRTYMLYFTVEKSVSALLQMIYLDGVELEGFEPETMHYEYLLGSGQSAPLISVEKGEGQRVSITQPLNVGTARIVVMPEEGEANEYRIRFLSGEETVIPEPEIPTYTPSANANVAMIYLGGDSLEGFSSEVDEYTIVLTHGTTDQPIVTAVAADLMAREMVIVQGDAGADATVRVLAEDSLTEKTYTLHFTLPKSSNTLLEDIDVEGYITYVQTERDYSFELPFGTAFPEVYVTKAEDEQTVEVSYLKCKTRRDVTIHVTAADGTVGTYTISMLIPTHPDNVLLSVVSDYFMLDSATLNAADTMVVRLPYGAASLGITALQKNYTDQYVVLRDGGALSPTTIWVYAGRAGEEAKQYTLVPEIENPYLLTDLQVDGVTIAGFAPDRMSYVMTVSARPEVSATAIEGATVEVVADEEKFCRVRVEYDDVHGPEYTIWYYYPGDVTFSTSFEDWVGVNNSISTNKVLDIDEAIPMGWHHPIDATTSGDKGTYNPENAIALSGDATDGTRSVNLKTIYLLTSAESMPGVLSLSPQSVNVGAYLVITHMSSSLSFGSGITFRNTPDSVALDYKALANNKVNAWHWEWYVNGAPQFDYEGSFATKNEWLTATQRLHYEEGLLPMQLDIRINPSQTTDLNTYYAGAGGGQARNQFTSSMLVDNLRMYYSSRLMSVGLAGQHLAPDASGHIAATLPSEHYGLPSVAFTGEVEDQAAHITWSDEAGGVRNATIRNYAEDGTYTDYTMTVTRPLSTDATYEVVNSTLADVVFRTTSLHASAAVTMMADSLRLTITAEAGAQRIETLSALTHDTVRVILDAVLPPAAKDSVLMSEQQTVYSDNLDLVCILIGEDTLRSYEPYTLDYKLFSALSETVTAVAGDAQQTVTVTTQTLTDGSDLCYIYVRAGNGDTRTYSVRITHDVPSDDASLAALWLDGEAMADFQSEQTDYSITLPAHSVLPDMICIPNDAEASIALTVVEQVYTIVVTAADGIATRTYTFSFQIPLSDYSTLMDILVDGAPMDDYAAATTTYNLSLPVGTTTLPEIDYVLLEAGQTVTIDTMAITAGVGGYTLTVTAEDGVHTTVYQLIFTVLKSDDAHLSMITLSGEVLADFYTDDTDYTVQLAYGATLPEIAATTRDAAAQLTIDTLSQTEYRLHVVAEDGVTEMNYLLHFEYLKSENALLEGIVLNGEALAEFSGEEYEYTITLPYGVALPEVAWTSGDEQQRVDTTWVGDVLTIMVTAGDEVNSAEYTLTFIHLKSSNCRLADLRVRGVTVDGFRPDSTDYTVVYPIGTRSEALFVLEDVSATAEDAEAEVRIEMVETTAQVFVTAADGSIRVYVVTQEILRSSEARIADIQLDMVSIADFSSDVYDYTIVLAQGAVLPDVAAVMVDTLASYELGLVEDTEVDGRAAKVLEIDGVAEDGTRVTYTLTFVYANWVPSGSVDSDDYLFLPIGGGDYKAVTIGAGVQIGVFDMAGHCHMLESIPTAGPGEVEVEVDEEGNQRLVSAATDAAGVVFHAQPGLVYLYVFYDSKQKRIAKAGKIMTE